MNLHLSDDQISKCLIGCGSAQDAQHVAECAVCSAGLARLESSLWKFRGSVRSWSDQAGSGEYAAPWSAQRSEPGRWIVNCENHLDRLLAPESIETPWYRGIVESIRDAIRAPKLPPLEVTSKPVAAASLKGLYAAQVTTAGVSSVLIHIAAVVVLLFVGTLKPVQLAIKEFIPLATPDLKWLQPKPQPEQSKGGGGSPQKVAATKGELPKVAPRQFVPPIRTVEDPKLSMTPTILALELPNINASNYGDPLGKIGIASTGNGIGVGIGPGKGAGVGPGSAGGFSGTAFKIGGGVSAPVPVYRPEPEYSEEARKAKWQGAVMLSLVVDENGVPQDIKVIRSIGLGLDQKAIEAVQKWRFKPGAKDGKAVPVIANIEVNFRLL
ncbi:MAG TPA: TonB family protein [Bryobacteraceae bacterium]